MAKTKDFKINFIEGQNDYVFSAKKKNAIYLKGLNQTDIDKTSFKIINDNLLFSTINGKNFTVSNYKDIKYIKTDIINSNKTELFDIISNNVVNNLSDITKYNFKKRAITGTSYNDTINAKLSDYIVPTTGKNKNKGLTIKGGNGNDTITGTIGDDTITGGAGTTIINYTKGDGNDVINLTKDENFTLNIYGVSDINDLKFSYANKDRDLRIYTDKNSSTEFITIKNFAKKNVVGLGKVELNLNGNIYDLRTSKDITDPKNPKNITLYKTEVTDKNFTGTYLNDEIDASNSVLYKKVKQGKKKVTVEKSIADSGLTLKGGAGNDSITGTKYSDKIYGNAGDDTINAGTGNNYIYFSKGDGADIIENGNGVDTLVFVKNTKLSYTQNKGDLVISYGNSDTVILKDFYKSGHSVKYIQIGKTKTDISTLIPEPTITEYTENDVRYYLGTKEANEITASDSYTNVAIYGYDGDDTITVKNHSGDIYAGKGADTIIIDGTSATANIHLTSGDGNNTLRFTDGNETKAVFLDFGENDIKCTKNENNLVIKYGDSDSLIIENYYTKTLDNIFLNENTTNINTLPIYVEGTNETDTLSNDTKGTTYIYAGTGTDTINATNDVETTIFLSENDGTKTVNWTKGTHQLNIKVDSATLYNSAKLLKNNNNLEIQYSSNATDKIIFTDFFTKSESDQTAYAQNINLFFGSVGNTGYKTGTLNSFITGSGSDSLYGFSITGEGTITGTKFSDKIIGSDNADTITTGAGNDTITVNKGVDTININGTGRKDIYFNTDDGDLTVNYTAEQNISNVIALHIEGVTSVDNNNLKFYQQNNDLLIKTPNSESEKDTIKIVGYYSNNNIPTGDNFKVYYEEDSDYAPISTFISNSCLIVAGSDSADNLTLPDGLNIVEPGKGDDTLTITATNSNYSDKIYISKGNGNDTVIYDTTENGSSKYTQFYFDKGTAIELEKSGDNFLINHTTDNLKETVTIQNFDYDNSGFREIFVGDAILNTISGLLADDNYGITINGNGAFSGLNQYKNKLNGSDGVDTITVGYGGSSTVNAKKGDDTIIFSANGTSAGGNDKLYFHNGDGNDTLQFNNNSFSSALNLYFDSDATITTEKSGDNLLIKRSYVENEVTKNETVTLENYLSKQYHENLWIYKGNDSVGIKTYVNQESVGIGTYKTYIVSNTNTNNTYTINQPISAVDVSIYDSLGNDDKLNIATTDHTKLHVAFNITKGGTSIIEDSLMILDNTNFVKWQNNMNDETIKGIKIGGTDITAIETIKTRDNYYLTSNELNNLKSNIASWLTNKGYADVTAVFDKAGDNSADIALLVEEFDKAGWNLLS